MGRGVLSPSLGSCLLHGVQKGAAGSSPTSDSHLAAPALHRVTGSLWQRPSPATTDPGNEQVLVSHLESGRDKIWESRVPKSHIVSALWTQVAGAAAALDSTDLGSCPRHHELSGSMLV